MHLKAMQDATAIRLAAQHAML